jgi:hypothetical protein
VGNPTLQKIKIKNLELDPACQPRAEMDDSVIQEYADAMRDGAKFPPIDVYDDGDKKRVSDGFYRVSAAVMAGVETLEARVYAGDRRAAILHSLGANATHGLRRTNADKRRAVATLLADPEWSQWSNFAIAKQCGVNDKTVASVRADLAPSLGNSEPAPTARLGSDGKFYPAHPQPRRQREPGDDDEEFGTGQIAPDVTGEMGSDEPEESEDEKFLGNCKLSKLLKGKALELFQQEALRWKKARTHLDAMKAAGLAKESEPGEPLGPFTRKIHAAVRFSAPHTWGKCLGCEGKATPGCKVCKGVGFVD